MVVVVVRGGRGSAPGGKQRHAPHGVASAAARHSSSVPYPSATCSMHRMLHIDVSSRRGSAGAPSAAATKHHVPSPA